MRIGVRGSGRSPSRIGKDRPRFRVTTKAHKARAIGAAELERRRQKFRERPSKRG